jgi:hypothetical protein
LHRRRKIIPLAEVIIIKVGWKLIISRGCRRRRRRRAERRASERTQALCGVIRPTFCLANLSYLTSAALEDKQRRARRKRRRRRTPKSQESEREPPAAIFYWKMKWRFIVRAKIYQHACVLLLRTPFLDWSGAWGLILRALLTLGSFGGYDQTSLCCFDTEPKGFAMVGSTVQHTQILFKR